MQPFDTHRPDLARAHDYLIGGRHNFAADRALAGVLLAASPDLADLLLENREFVRQAVAQVAGHGVRQFLDVGSGLPFAHSVCPGSRVAYVDHDPAVRSYGSSLLSPDDGARFIDGDLAEPEGLLASEALAAVIDMSQPVCLILSLVLHLLEESTARGVTGVLVRALAQGSYVIISTIAPGAHGGSGAGVGPAGVRPAAGTPAATPGTESIEPLFGGLDIVPPGLGDARAWGAPAAGPFPPRRDVVLCGVGRKTL